MISPSRVVLFGGSSVRTSYLPEAAQHHNVLREALSHAYPHQSVEVSNCADNGEFIARYLLTGKYEKHRETLAGIDIAIIRFGANDQKRMDVAEYKAHTNHFVDLLESDFPGLTIVMETGTYFDYPAHYAFNRNLQLDPYWDVARQVAKERGYLLADYYAVMQKKTAQGEWDFRVRQGLIIDNSQDAGKENDPKWFSDIHPNPAGTRLAVEEEFRCLKAAFPNALPTGQQRTPRPARKGTEYAQLLNFPFERLTQLTQPNPEQVLQ